MHFGRRAPYLVNCALLLAVGCGGSSAASPDAAAADASAPDAGSATIVPAETADERALRALGDWRALPAFADGAYRLASSRDTGAGEPLPYPLFAMDNRDMNHFLCASADAEVTAPQLVPFLFEQESCPESYVQGFVIARFEGSGRLARLWLTSASLLVGEAERELLRIYVDDEEQPLVQVPTPALADGSAGEIFAPPFGAGAAHFVAWYYPVVFSKKLIVTVDRLNASSVFFHQTGVVLDPEPGERLRAPVRLAARDDAAATLAARAAGPLGGLAALKTLAPLTLAPDVPTSAASLTGPGVIQTLRVRIAEAEVARLADVDVSVSWDGAAAAAIDLPLAELFAIAADVPAEPSLALAASRADGLLTLSLRLPMPFATGAELTLHNRDSVPVTLELGLDGDVGPLAPGLGRLHVVRHETLGPTSASYHPLVAAGGQGRLIGVCLTMEGHAIGSASDPFASGYNFLEGDERGTVDGVLSLQGTGTEDYLNSAFYYESGPFGTAFAQAWGLALDEQATPASARVSGCRWHVLGDAVDFASALDLELEIGPAEPSLLDRYRSVAFVYLATP